MTTPPSDFARHQPVPPAASPNRPVPATPTPGTVVPSGPVGRVRGTGVSMLLFVVTLGIYGYVWWYKVHAELRAHRGGVGLGGPLALLIAIIVTPVMAYLTAHEIGQANEQAGRPQQVSAATGLWYVPGNLIVVGPIVWFVKVNGALNDYWRSVGAA